MLSEDELQRFVDQYDESNDRREIIVALDAKLRPDDGASAAVIRHYDQLIRHACMIFTVPLSTPEVPDTAPSENRGRAFRDLVTEVDKMRIDLLGLKIDKARAGTGVALDATWRTKIHSHLATVRGIVEGAELSKPIRDSILTKLHDLDREVDRDRTRVQKFSDALVGICEGISAGAEALKPAARLFERIIGSLERLKRQEVRPLPPPETLGLPDYTTKSDGEDEATE